MATVPSTDRTHDGLKKKSLGELSRRILSRSSSLHLAALLYDEIGRCKLERHELELLSSDADVALIEAVRHLDAFVINKFRESCVMLAEETLTPEYLRDNDCSDCYILLGTEEQARRFGSDIIWLDQVDRQPGWQRVINVGLLRGADGNRARVFFDRLSPDGIICLRPGPVDLVCRPDEICSQMYQERQDSPVKLVMNYKLH